MRGFGLSDVAVEGVEDVEVDGWRFNSPQVSLSAESGDLTIEGCSFGGRLEHTYQVVRLQGGAWKPEGAAVDTESTGG